MNLTEKQFIKLTQAIEGLYPDECSGFEVYAVRATTENTYKASFTYENVNDKLRSNSVVFVANFCNGDFTDFEEIM